VLAVPRRRRQWRRARPEHPGPAPSRDDAELAELIREGLPRAGMPGFPMADGDLHALTPSSAPSARGGDRAGAHDRGDDRGGTLSGLVLNQTALDMELLGEDKRLHCSQGGQPYRPVTSQVDWPTITASRWQSLHHPRPDQPGQRDALAPPLDLHPAGDRRLQVTPVVVDGTMYVTAPTSATPWMPVTGVESGTTSVAAPRA